MDPKEIVKRLFRNSAFCDACTLHIQRITNDGVVDAKDIPSLMLIVGTVYQYRGKIQLSSIDIGPVFKELLIALIDKYHLFAGPQRTAAIESIESLIPLITMSISMIKGQCCTCFRPDTSEDEMANEIDVITQSRTQESKIPERTQ